MPMYNSEDFIKVTLESVLAQTYQNWELLIIDDCSTDSSVKIVEIYCKRDFRIKLFRNPKNIGVSESRNQGILKSTGNYLSFLDSDDILTPNKLEKQLNFMFKNKYPFTFSSYYKINEDGTIRGIINAPEIANIESQLISNMMPTFTVMLDTEITGKPSFDLSDFSEDLLYWNKVLDIVGVAHSINEPLGYYRVLRGSRSANKLKLVAYQLQIIKKQYPKQPLKQLVIFFKYLYYGFLKYIT